MIESSDIEGKRFLVTGGSRRIGRAICLRLAAAGAKIVVSYHNSAREADELVDALSQLHTGHDKIMCNLAVQEQRDRLIPALMERGLALDGLVNNASVYRRSALSACLPADAHADYEINFFAPLQLMRDFSTLCGRGVIINMLDQRIHLVEPAAGTYGLAKKSLRDATEAAAVEWAPDIRVNAVAPGFVLPPPGVAAEKMKALLHQIPMQTQTSKEEVADAVYFLINAQTITGQILFVDGGMHLGRPTAGEKS